MLGLAGDKLGNAIGVGHAGENHESDSGALDANAADAEPPAGEPTRCPLPDAGAQRAWQVPAPMFASDNGVMFELYNEPHENDNGFGNVTWDVWQNGGDTGQGWQAVGMQQLYDTVRATGANYSHGAFSTGHLANFTPFAADNTHYMDINTNTVLHPAAPSTVQGMWTLTRTSSVAVRSDQNGVQFASSGANNSVTPPSFNFFVDAFPLASKS